MHGDVPVEKSCVMQRTGLGQVRVVSRGVGKGGLVKGRQRNCPAVSGESAGLWMRVSLDQAVDDLALR